MTNATRTKRLAAIALLGLASLGTIAAPAYAEEAAQNQKKQIGMRATGAISTGADTRSREDGIVCRVTRGDASAKFPPAPVNPAFGF